jgi:glucokinase
MATPPSSPDSQFIIGVDLGGTNIVVSAMSRDGSRLFGVQTEPTLAAEGADAVINRMARMVNTTVGIAMKEASGSARLARSIGKRGWCSRRRISSGTTSRSSSA